MEGLGNNQRSNFIGIAQGKITYRPSKDAPRQEFDYVEGQIKKITKRSATINGERMEFYDILIQASKESYVLSIPVESSVSRSIINSLMSVNDFSGKIIRINPYVKTVGDSVYTNVAIRANGEKVDWFRKDMPKPKVVRVNKKDVSDFSEIDEIIEDFVEVLNKRFAEAQSVSAEAQGAVDYDDNDPRYAPEPGGDLPEGDVMLHNGR